MTSSIIIPASMVVQDQVVDSARWSEFPFRTDDIIIDTFWKTGTTWVQQIVGQLVFEGADDADIGVISPWIEYRAIPWHEVIATIQGQSHRRFVKTHLPRSALPYCSTALYIYVGRDARDQIWSAHNHLVNLKPSALLSTGEGCDAGRVCSRDVKEYYLSLMDRHEPDVWPYWSHVSSWWSARHLPNVLLVHYSDLKTDMRAEIMRIAEFLRINVSDPLMRKIVKHSEFEYMKNNAPRFAGPGAGALRNGPSNLFYKGTNRRWKSVLTEEEISKCDTVASRYLSPECAQWLRDGRFGVVSSTSTSTSEEYLVGISTKVPTGAAGHPSDSRPAPV